MRVVSVVAMETAGRVRMLPQHHRAAESFVRGHQLQYRHEFCGSIDRGRTKADGLFRSASAHSMGRATRTLPYRATRYGFSYWLDVLNPDLRRLHERRLDPGQKALLLAQIVETALMDCTHVVAVLTNSAKRSRWIPYEFGRVKERAISTQLAMAWITSSYSGYLPEYVVLGAQARHEQEINEWFRGQRAWFRNRKGKGPLGPFNRRF